MSQDDTFFTDEDGEVYWGLGHLPAGEFVAKVNADAVMADPDGFENVSTSQVQHLWAVWTDDVPHESFRVVVFSTPGAWPITRCAYDGHLLTVQSNRPQPQTRRDRRIAELEEKNKRLSEFNKFIYEGSAAQKVAGLKIELAERERMLRLAAFDSVGGWGVSEEPTEDWSGHRWLADLRTRAEAERSAP